MEIVGQRPDGLVLVRNLTEGTKRRHRINPDEEYGEPDEEPASPTRPLVIAKVETNCGSTSITLVRPGAKWKTGWMPRGS